MHYHLTYFGTGLRKLSHQPGIQQTLREHEYGLVYHALYLFTLPAFAGYSFQPNHRRRTTSTQTQAYSGLGLRRGGLPV